MKRERPGGEVVSLHKLRLTRLDMSHLLPYLMLVLAFSLPLIPLGLFLIPLGLDLSFPRLRPMSDDGDAQVSVILLNRVEERFILDGQEDGSVPLGMRGETLRYRSWSDHVGDASVERSGERAVIPSRMGPGGVEVMVTMCFRDQMVHDRRGFLHETPGGESDYDHQGVGIDGNDLMSLSTCYSSTTVHMVTL